MTLRTWWRSMRRRAAVVIMPAPESAPDPDWGGNPKITCNLLLLTGYPWKHDENELLAVVRVWTREQRATAEQWAAAVHVGASDHDDVDVPEIPAHVDVLVADLWGYTDD